MDIVLDTNVLVAGLRSCLGASYRILQLAAQESKPFAYHLSSTLVFEYEEVLVRGLFSHVD